MNNNCFIRELELCEENCKCLTKFSNDDKTNTQARYVTLLGDVFEEIEED